MLLDRRAFSVASAALLTGCATTSGRRFTSCTPLPPVKVDESRVIRTVAGLRPYRRSGFVVRAEQLGEKRLVHNYGHGGGGITLSWGSSKLATELGLQDHSGPVAVLGAGVMAMFNATLTLPGIAGFILTIGAAVDANVLINERIREEMHRGRRIIDAVETGYREAMHAIIDANVTHVISAGIMAYFGSGPVRGFAIVLLIGVVTSVFTAVYFTRMLVALWIRRTRPRAINI